MILCGSIIGFFSFRIEINTTYRETEKQSEDYIQLIAAQTTQILTDINQENSLQSTETSIVSQLSNDPQLQIIAVIDHQDIIQEASNFSLKQQSLDNTEIKEYIQSVELARKLRAGQTFFINKNQQIVAFYPFFLERLPKEFSPSRIGVLFLKYDLSHAKKIAFNSASQRAIFFNGLLILFYVGLWLFFDRALTRRITKLVNASHDIAQGNLDTRSNLKGSDELAEVSIAFDFMANKIQENTRRLETALIVKEKIFKQLEKQHQELYTLNQKLEQATEAKAKFLANMSHEIRTPMNGVLGIAQLLATTDLSEQQQDFVSIISDSGDTLLTIINDILDFSKIESGKLSLESKSVNFEKVVQSVINLLAAQSQAKNLQVRYVSHTDKSEYFLGDEVRLRQILLNLVGNALKFTSQGSVTISTFASCFDLQGRSPTESDHCITVKIQDTGIGIDGDRLSQLFKPFTQADTSITRKYGGTGLGLVISKSLIELMGGTIWVESQGNVAGSPPKDWQPEFTSQSIGTTFYFTIPTTLIDETQTQNANLKIAVENRNPHRFGQLKILLAEDNLVNQKVMLLVLERLDLHVDVANNGREVLDRLNQKDYDVIFMDVQMPELDGINTTKQIRETLSHQPYIIALTANVLDSDRQTALDAGMNDFLAKPIVVQEVIAALITFLEQTSETTSENK